MAWRGAWRAARRVWLFSLRLGGGSERSVPERPKITRRKHLKVADFPEIQGRIYI